MPLVHVDDPPIEDVYALALQVSVPASLEAFVQRRAAGGVGVQVCHDTERIVVRRGRETLGAECRAKPGDQVIAFASNANKAG